MPIALLVLGFALAAVGINGTQSQLAALIASDFSGAGSFWYFVIGIFFAGSVGYYSPLSDTSRLLIVLICLVFLLSNNGFWTNLQQAIKSPKGVAKPADPSASVPSATLSSPLNAVQKSAATATGDAVTAITGDKSAGEAAKIISGGAAALNFGTFLNLPTLVLGAVANSGAN